MKSVSLLYHLFITNVLLTVLEKDKYLEDTFIRPSYNVFMKRRVFPGGGWKLGLLTGKEETEKAELC